MPVWFHLIPGLVRFYELKNWIWLTLSLNMKKKPDQVVWIKLKLGVCGLKW